VESGKNYSGVDLYKHMYYTNGCHTEQGHQRVYVQRNSSSLLTVFLPLDFLFMNANLLM